MIYTDQFIALFSQQMDQTEVAFVGVWNLSNREIS